MNIQGKSFEILTKYPGFVLGTKTDKDVLARMCGVLNNEAVALGTYVTDKYKFYLELRNVGDQSFNINYNDIPEDQYFAQASAQKNKLSGEKEIELMLKMLEDNEIDFRNNCWYEASISILDIKENKMILTNTMESEIGLEGVWESISEFKEYMENDDNLISYIECILEDLDLN